MNEIYDLVTAAEDFGEAGEIDVVNRLVSVAGLRLVDVGAGDGRFTRLLAARGAEALGVEPDPIQAEKNRAAEPTPGLTFAEAPGQDLPLDDASADGVFFSHSLHHVAPGDMDRALAEAARVLRPESGFLYVLEPLLSGSHDALYKPFHDETEVRRLAYDAVLRVAPPRFTHAREVRYREPIRYDGYDQFVAETASTTYTDFSRDSVDTPEVRALFEAGRTGDGGYVFIQHARVNLFRGPRPDG